MNSHPENLLFSQALMCQKTYRRQVTFGKIWFLSTRC
jgi:hypothetical protein